MSFYHAITLKTTKYNTRYSGILPFSSLFLLLSLSISVSLSLSLSLSLLSLHLSFSLYLSFFLSLSIYIYLSIYLSINLYHPLSFSLDLCKKKLIGSVCDYIQENLRKFYAFLVSAGNRYLQITLSVRLNRELWLSAYRSSEHLFFSAWFRLQCLIYTKI